MVVWSLECQQLGLGFDGYISSWDSRTNFHVACFHALNIPTQTYNCDAHISNGQGSQRTRRAKYAREKRKAADEPKPQLKRAGAKPDLTRQILVASFFLSPSLISKRLQQRTIYINNSGTTTYIATGTWKNFVSKRKRTLVSFPFRIR